jgi:hypothetical protein
MTRITFTELQEINTGSADNYITPKEINEQIHMNSIKERRKREVFTMSDMRKNSENFISSHIYDVGHGDFVTLGNLEIEMIGLG